MINKLKFIFIVSITSIIVYACCQDEVYNANISKLNYVSIKDTCDSYYNLIKFQIEQDLIKVSYLPGINEAKADAFPKVSTCGSKTTNNYIDTVSSLTFTCNKDLGSFKAGENLTIVKIDYDRFINQNLNQIIHILNTKPNSNKTFDMFIYFDESLFNNDFNSFTLTLKTSQGKEFKATTKPIYLKKS